MKIEFLGSGGAMTTPAVGSDALVSQQARKMGLPYTRTGPSVFVHGPDVLIDTPEESKLQLNRAGIRHVPAAVYSHWHPDHTLGYRMWESLNGDWRNFPPQHRTTDIYLPQQVAEDFKVYLGAWGQLQYLQKVGLVNVNVLNDGDTISRNGVEFLPFRVAEDYVYAFYIQVAGKRLLIAPDELFGWTPPDFLHGVDLAIIPMGIPQKNVFTGEDALSADHPVFKHEATFLQTLAMVRHMQPERVIMTHIEESFDLSYDDFLRLEIKLASEGYPIQFAYDTLMVEV